MDATEETAQQGKRIKTKETPQMSGRTKPRKTTQQGKPTATQDIKGKNDPQENGNCNYELPAATFAFGYFLKIY